MSEERRAAKAEFVNDYPAREALRKSLEREDDAFRLLSAAEKYVREAVLYDKHDFEAIGLECSISRWLSDYREKPEWKETT